jgi:hypothetical protein
MERPNLLFVLLDRLGSHAIFDPSSGARTPTIEGLLIEVLHPPQAEVEAPTPQARGPGMMRGMASDPMVVNTR